MKEEIKEQVQHILITLSKMLKESDKTNDSTSNQIMQNLSKKRAHAFQQFCFYAKYKDLPSNNLGTLQTDYLKWKTIYNAYNNPTKLLIDLNNGKLTKRQQQAIIKHFLTQNYFKHKDKNQFLSQTQKLIEQKLLNSK